MAKKETWEDRKKTLTQLEQTVLTLLAEREHRSEFTGFEGIRQEAEVVLQRHVTDQEFAVAVKRLAVRELINVRVRESD